MNTYKTDYYAWTHETAAKLRQGRFTEVDMEQIAEELEEMGRSERHELKNRLAVLLTHLLKWQYQPERRGNSWRLTIEEQRLRAKQVLYENPSLKSQLAETVSKAYVLAVLQTAREINLAKSIFPSTFEQINWSLEQVLDEEFYPD